MSGSSRPVLVLIAALAVVVIGGLVLVLSGPGAERPDEGPGGRVTSVEELGAVAPCELAPTEDGERTGLGLLPGDELIYRFAMDESVNMSAPRIGNREAEGARHLRTGMRFEGVLVLRVFEERGDDFAVGLSVRDFRIEVESPEGADGPTAEVPERLREEIGKELLAEMTREGEVRSIRFATGMGSAARNRVKSVLARFEIPLAKDGVASWEVRRHDATGFYTMRYERAGDADALPVEIRGTRSGYEALRTDEGEEIPVDAETTGTSLHVLDPVPRRIEGRQTTVLHPEPSGQRIEATAGYRFVRTAHRRGTAEIGDREERFEPSTAASLWGTEGGDAAKLTPEAARAQALELVAALGDAVRRHGLDHPGVHRASSRLLKLLESRPEAAERVRERLREGDLTKDEATVLPSCLGAAGTPACQEALISVLDDRAATPAVRRHALLAFVRVEEPIAEVDPVIARIVDAGGEMSGNAFLVLAAVGGKTDDAARASAIRTRVLGRLRDARGDEETIRTLRALSNVGGDTVPEAVGTYLASDDLEIRAAAAKSLLRMRTPEADRTLVRLVKTSREPETRAVALDVLVRRRTEGHAPEAVKEVPIEDLLRVAARSDDDPAVRKRAAKLLERLGGRD